MSAINNSVNSNSAISNSVAKTIGFDDTSDEEEEIQFITSDEEDLDTSDEEPVEVQRVKPAKPHKVVSDNQKGEPKRVSPSGILAAPVGNKELLTKERELNKEYIKLTSVRNGAAWLMIRHASIEMVNAVARLYHVVGIVYAETCQEACDRIHKYLTKEAKYDITETYVNYLRSDLADVMKEIHSLHDVLESMICAIDRGDWSTARNCIDHYVFEVTNSDEEPWTEKLDVYVNDLCLTIDSLSLDASFEKFTDDLVQAHVTLKRCMFNMTAVLNVRSERIVTHMITSAYPYVTAEECHREEAKRAEALDKLHEETRAYTRAVLNALSEP